MSLMLPTVGLPPHPQSGTDLLHDRRRRADIVTLL